MRIYRAQVAKAALRAALVAATLLAFVPRSARADEPTSVPSAEAVTEVRQEPTEQALIEPAPSHPPWSGREAIWGGVGLIIAGAATLIVVAPALCTSSLFGSGSTAGLGTTSTGPTSRTTCLEATIGGGAGGAALGIILLAVGETQRATYKAWLRAHPMFGQLSITPEARGRGPALAWTVSF